MNAIFGKVFAASFLAMTVACGGGADSNEAREKAMEDTAKKHGLDVDVTVGENGDAEQIVINNGAAQVGQNLNLPNNFPEDISLPSGWNIMSSAPVPNGFSVQAIVSDDADTIINGLRGKMSADGWTEAVADQPTPQMSRINFEKDDRMANFNIMANGETNMVQLMTMVRP